MHRSRIALLLAVLALVVAFPAAASQSASTTVAVGMTEMKFTFSKKVVPAGTVTLKLTNKGFLPHDIKIAGKKSPRIAAKKTGVLKVILKPGKYAYLCTVPGHAAAGMKGTLTVTK